jgi:hypothetical protein
MALRCATSQEFIHGLCHNQHRGSLFSGGKRADDLFNLPRSHHLRKLVFFYPGNSASRQRAFFPLW